MSKNQGFTMSNTSEVSLIDTKTGDIIFKGNTATSNISIAQVTDKQKINYPDGFFDYSNGVNISDERINEWIQECIYKIENSEASSWSISSGNTKVTVDKGHRLDGVKYYIDVSKSRKELIVYE